MPFATYSWEDLGTKDAPFYHNGKREILFYVFLLNCDKEHIVLVLVFVVFNT